MKLNIAIIDNEAPFRKSIATAVDEWVKKSKISAQFAPIRLFGSVAPFFLREWL